MMPGQVSDFWAFEPPILAVVPATLPLSYTLKPDPKGLKSITTMMINNTAVGNQLERSVGFYT